MDKNITYNAQGELIMDKNIPKYNNVPNSTLFSTNKHGREATYFIIDDNNDLSSTSTWNSTYVNDSGTESFTQDILEKFKSKNSCYYKSRRNSPTNLSSH